MWHSYSFRPYVSVAQRRAQAARELQKRLKKGQTASPVVIDGRTIARTFWGKAWCENLESYSDYENRLPRGRSYVRNGSVVDLKIEAGKITALVSGSELYEIVIKITSLPDAHWGQIKSKCSGQIGSLVELLQGRLSKGVMDIVTARDGGLFPKPGEIKMTCSCPDWAGLCKHLAATMYGVATRLDREPELLFRLRQVDHLELIEQAVPVGAGQKASSGKTLAQNEVADVFGIEFATPDVEALPEPAQKATPKRTAKPKSAAAAGKSPKATTRKAGKAQAGARAAAKSAKAKKTAKN